MNNNPMTLAPASTFRRPRNPGLTFAVVATLFMLPLSGNLAGRGYAQQQSSAPTDGNAASSDGAYQSQVLALVTDFCFECHDSETATADVVLDDYKTPQAVLDDTSTWERVFRVLESDAMPPPDEPRPDADQRRAALRWLEENLFNMDCLPNGDPGRPTIRRLNRVEYNNTIRDLIGIDLRTADDFPADSVGHGFDNVGDVLSLSPMLMEKYLAAAETISAAAIVNLDRSALKPLTDRREAGQLQHTGGVALGNHGFQILYSRGEVFAEFELPVTGEYLLKATAAADQAGPDVAKMQFRLDDEDLKVFEVHGHRKVKDYEFQLRAGRGRHRFAVAFLNDYYRPDAEDPQDRDRNLGIGGLEIAGPVNADALEYPESHQRIIFTRPGPEKSLADAARDVLRRFASRAFRRPVSENELDDLVQLVMLAVERRGATFEEGIQVAVQAVLVSPHFLFRVESPTAVLEPEQQTKTAHTRRLSGYELATRLSYFLWSSMPDDELFELAERDELQHPSILEGQVQRMLSDEKAAALAANFAGQWLNLRLLEDVKPDPERFSTFNDQLRADMVKETELLFQTIMRDNRSILEFLHADFTFLNGRLARHYGLDDIPGEAFVRTSLAGTQRRGVLTHASILTLTSNPARTSPVKRGKWILDNLLGMPPPPPPPDVPPLEAVSESTVTMTMAEQMALHRSKPECTTCHKRMDPLGLGLENFDPIGRWRQRDGELAIEAAGKLPGGETFRGPAELIEILNTTQRQDQFCRVLIEKMLTYALGRALRFEDRCRVRAIAKTVRENGYRSRHLVNEIVRTDAFISRREDDLESRTRTP